MTRSGTLVTALVLLALTVVFATGCGDEENTPGAPPGVPAAGENTPPSGTPGVPEGAAYDIDGRGWNKLSQSARFEATSEFIADNPDLCKDANVGEVVGWVETSYGLDYPQDTAAAYVLEEGCTAALSD